MSLKSFFTYRFLLPLLKIFSSCISWRLKRRSWYLVWFRFDFFFLFLASLLHRWWCVFTSSGTQYLFWGLIFFSLFLVSDPRSIISLKVKVKFTQLCLTLWDPKDYTVHGILQARILKWVVFPSSRRSSQPLILSFLLHLPVGICL